MPRDVVAVRPPRQRPISCVFCRSRKLRCSRVVPCSNCASRGLECRLEGDKQRARKEGGGSGTESAGEMMERIKRLEELVSRHFIQEDKGGQDREQVDISGQMDSGQVDDGGQEAPQTWLPLSEPIPNAGQKPASPPIETTTATPAVSSPYLRHVNMDIAWLEEVSRVQYGGDDKLSPRPMVFKVCPIQTIPQTPLYLWPQANNAMDEPVRCIWLPLRHEAKAILARFITRVSYQYHVVHQPSLPAMVDGVYASLSNGSLGTNLGPLALLLAIIAGTTGGWTAWSSGERGGGAVCDATDADSEDLFSTPEEATLQVPLWTRAALDVIDAARSSPSSLSLELIQSIIVTSFAIINLEGLSLRVRVLFSSCFAMARELCLHRIDHPDRSQALPGTPMQHTVRAEIGRRLWWYLVATDWQVAARYSGSMERVYSSHPAHMAVRLPRNVNDEDLVDGDGGVPFERPAEEPTDMSYFLQRIRVGELCRVIVDQNPISSGGALSLPIPGVLADSSTSQSYEAVLAIDDELETFINGVPPFFRIDAPSLSLPRRRNIAIQAYMLNCLFYTQRCKLHLRYLTSGHPQHTRSRQVCLASAVEVVRNELRVEREDHPFVKARLRHTGTLYAIFMASIVLLMDVCAQRGPGGSGDKTIPRAGGRAEHVAQAFRVLEEARGHNFAAARLLDALMQVLVKYKMRPPEVYPVGGSDMRGGEGGDEGRVVMGIDVPMLGAGEHLRALMEPANPMTIPLFFSAGPVQPVYTGMCGGVGGYEFGSAHTPGTDSSGSTSSVSGVDAIGAGTAISTGAVSGSTAGGSILSAATTAPTTYFDELALNLERVTEMEDFRWDDIFSDMRGFM